ncbi:MAG: peptidylprolyl isomerase [Actinomycetales bacterium]|nr:peptidylprolyl isomerase [Actinomycetales bacterium]
MSPQPWIARVVPLLVGALLVTGCATTAPPKPPPTTARVTTLDDVRVSGEQGDKPKIDFPKPFVVTSTDKRILHQGDGITLSEGVNIRMHYLGVNGTDGKEFDTSYGSKAHPTAFDPESLIPGFFKALVGVKVGARVLIAIPPEDGYGIKGAPAAGIGPTDTLLFVVDVTSARKPLTHAEGSKVTPKRKNLPTVTSGKGGRPRVGIPGGAPPTSLIVQPLIKGTGPKVVKGQTITVHLLGLVWSGKRQFESSWGGRPDNFRIGVGEALQALDIGLVGQPIGSRVLFVIPPDQGFGAEGRPSEGIKGTDTLVIVVDILDSA